MILVCSKLFKIISERIYKIKINWNFIHYKALDKMYIKKSQMHIGMGYPNSLQKSSINMSPHIQSEL